MIDILACVGLHWILKYGTILDPIRSIFTRVNLFKQLINCSLCLGFWCGVFVGLFVSVWGLSFASAACCWFVDNLNNTLQSVEIKLDKRD